MKLLLIVIMLVGMALFALSIIDGRKADCGERRMDAAFLLGLSLMVFAVDIALALLWWLFGFLFGWV